MLADLMKRRTVPFPKPEYDPLAPIITSPDTAIVLLLIIKVLVADILGLEEVIHMVTLSLEIINSAVYNTAKQSHEKQKHTIMKK